jgi:hypothetical protein
VVALIGPSPSRGHWRAERKLSQRGYRLSNEETRQETMTIDLDVKMEYLRPGDKFDDYVALTLFLKEYFIAHW